MSRVVFAVFLATASVACDGPADEAASVRVFAASSLTEAMGALGAGFEEVSGAEVVTSFAGSQILRLQIEEGAPADVFASADRRHMDALVADRLVEPPVVLCRNELVVITPAGDRTVGTFADLSRAERVVVGDDAVPVGRYTQQLLARAGATLGAAWRREVEAHVVSRESNVRGVRARVEMGEADAAIVYRTDAVGSSALRIVEIPEGLSAPAEYLIAPVARSPRGELARRFVDHATGPAGQRELERHGFLPAR